MQKFFRNGTAIAVIFSMMPLSAFAATSPAPAFSDLSEKQPNRVAVEYLKNQKIIQGYPDGTFKPDFTINRAEFTKIVIGAVVANPVGANCFSDVKDEWFAKYICTAKEKGIIEGYPDGTFKPAQNINFAEGSKVLIKAFNLPQTAETKTDVWFKAYVETLQKQKAIPVSIDYAEKKLTRGEMSEMAWRLKENIQTKPTKTFDQLTSSLPAITSCAELKEKFEAQDYRSNRRYRGMPMDFMRVEGAGPETGAGAEGAVTPVAAMMNAEKTATDSTQEYSTTNTQVVGVDEGDIIKNDGKYIYIIKGRTIRIVQANPPDAMKEVSKIQTPDNFDFMPQEMYVTENALVAVGTTYESGDTKTNVYVFDITDREKPVQKRKFSFDGDYVSSRRIGQQVYFVMNQYPNYVGMEGAGKAENLVPKYFDSKTNKEMPVAGCAGIHFFPRYDQPNFLIIASVPLDNITDGTIKKQVYMGSGSTIYSSLESLYIATEKHDYNETASYDIWEPKITDAKTNFYRFALQDGSIEYKGTGEVPGTLLNQFSMDEDGATFRVATSKGEFWGDSTPTNQLYILDRDHMGNILGKIENIGVGEKIKSVRFMGKRAYVVTFKNIDPFFVIDLSTPTNPKILGELKIPGYSDYLHPYDENHIIGFGKDADETIDADKVHSANAVYYTAILGMKIALFDVTDVTQPKEMFKEIIGDRGTESELLTNHKALFFNKSKGLFGFPIQVAEIKNKDPKNPGASGEVVFHGAYVYSLDLEKGFQLKAKISHFDESKPIGYGSDGTLAQPLYGANSLMIQRLLTIGNTLYSVSLGKVQANTLADMSKQGEAALTNEDDGGISEPVMY
ncbi:MAG: beta-propeller domain-containing protein [Patescibacteria group bacterium]